MGSFNGCFSDNFGIRNTLCAEFMGVILTIELADRNGWNNLWLDGRTTFSEKATPVQKLLPLLLLLFLDSVGLIGFSNYRFNQIVFLLGLVHAPMLL